MRFVQRLLPLFLSGAAIWLASTALSGCIIGGTGTDTENGIVKGDPKNDNIAQASVGVSARIIDSTGQPIAGIVLTALDPAFRPDSGSLTFKDALVPQGVNQTQAISDANGKVSFSVVAAGTYVVEGSKDGKPLFFDTLKVVDVKVATPVTFMARKVRTFHGKVRLSSGMHIDSGKVFIRGTRRFVKVDSAGSYDLGALPVDVEHMAIGLRYVSSPTTVLEVNQTLVKRDTLIDKNIPTLTGNDTLKLVYTCKDLPADSAARISVPITADSAVIDTVKREPVALTPKDSIRVNTALKSCDYVPVGAVVNVKALDPVLGINTVKTDSLSGTYLIRKDISLVSYSLCVEAPGSEKTSYEVKLEPSVAGSDLLVGDLSGACGKP